MLMTSVRVIAQNERQLLQNLNKIENWATGISFKFPKSKTQCQLRNLHNDPVLHFAMFYMYLDHLFLLFRI